MNSYDPKFLKLWAMPDNYFGRVWPATYCAGFGRSRDSDCLEESNFQTAKKAILAASVCEETQLVREGHWGVGWVEWIAIHQDDYAALKVADECVAAVADYPVLDDSDFSEREQAEADRIWSDCYRVKDRIEYIRNASKGEFEFRSFADLLGCVRGKYFAGYASELVNS